MAAGWFGIAAVSSSSSSSSSYSSLFMRRKNCLVFRIISRISRVIAF
jgi:hypothetical protein